MKDESQQQLVKVHNGKLVEVPISALRIDYDWNVRDVRLETPETGAELSDLWQGIRRVGVRVPIDVERTTGDDGYAYRVIAGFRRAHITRTIWEEEKRDGAAAAKERTIPCLIRAWASEPARRQHNLQENLGRKNLKPVELARGLGEYCRASERPGEELKAATVGEVFGITDRYVSNLLRIERKATPEVLEFWRRWTDIPWKKVVDVCILPPERQLDALKESIKPKVAAPKPITVTHHAWEMARAEYGKTANTQTAAWLAGVDWLRKQLDLPALRAPKGKGGAK